MSDPALYRLMTWLSPAYPVGSFSYSGGLETEKRSQPPISATTSVTCAPGPPLGAPGAAKSLLGPHLGYAVAQGREAFGMRTRQGGVLYVAAEDARGMRGLRGRFEPDA